MTTNRRILFFGSLAVSALVVAFGGGLLVAAQGAGSGAPYLLPYQGVLELEGELVDTQGQAQGVTFSVRIEDGAGVKVWPDGDWEVHEGVPVHAGRFSLMLGAITTLPEALFDGGPRFAHLQVEYAGSGTVDMGRQELLAAPHALRARRATIAETAEKVGPAALSVKTFPERQIVDTDRGGGPAVRTDLLIGGDDAAKAICFLTKAEGQSAQKDWGDESQMTFNSSCEVIKDAEGWKLRTSALKECDGGSNGWSFVCDWGETHAYCNAMCLTWK